MIRVHVHGANGRLGQAIVRIATDTGGYVVSKSGRKDDLSSPISECDVAIDVSQPEGSVAIAACCVANGKPLVIGTTGHSAVQLESLKAGAARIATLGTRICLAMGVEIAHWLFSQTNTIGNAWTAAKFIASCHSPCDVAPSPNWQNTTRAFSLRYLIAHAAPTACVQCAAMIEEIDAIPSFFDVTWLMIERPPVVSFARASCERNTSTSGNPHDRTMPVLR